MGVSIEWDNEAKTAIRYNFEPFWTWQDFIEAARSDDALIDSVDHTVHLIFDVQHIEIVPANPLQHLKALGGGIHPRLGLIIFVGNNAWAKMVLEIFYQVYGARAEGLTGIHAVRTLDEARQIIADYGASVG
jgi:hypothetical protein